MRYARLGRSGLTVSRVCLGGNSWGARGRRSWAGFDAADSRAFFARALDRGVNFFDTADSYNGGASEEVMGAELVGSVPRHDLVLTTKVGNPMRDAPNRGGLGAKHVIASIDASLARLKTDHVDVYMIHRYDPATPVEEIAQTFAGVVAAGKARYLGVSTMRPTQFARLQTFCRANGLPTFIVMQNLYNLLRRGEDEDTIPFCREEGVALTPYSPLARGVLSGTRGRDGAATERGREDKLAAPYLDAASFATVDRVGALARSIGASPSQVALSWLLHQEGVVAPVVGVTRPEQIDDAVAATELALSPDQIAALTA